MVSILMHHARCLIGGLFPPKGQDTLRRRMDEVPVARHDQTVAIVEVLRERDDGTGEELDMANADHQASASPALRSRELAAVAPKFAEGYARVRDVTDHDGACPAWAKALFIAAAAAVRDHDEMCEREMHRAVGLGLEQQAADGAALAVLISRGEAVYERFRGAADRAFGVSRPSSTTTIPEFEIDHQGALDYFTDYFGFVPGYIDLMAEESPRGLEGYVLMRQWSLAENPLGAKWVELMLCTMNAAEFSSRFVNVHANGARAAGATEAEIVESVVCAIPVSGVAAWLPGADGIMEGRTGGASSTG